MWVGTQTRIVDRLDWVGKFVDWAYGKMDPRVTLTQSAYPLQNTYYNTKSGRGKDN